MLNTLVNKLSIHNGLQSALFVPTLDVVSEYKGFPRICYSLKLHVRMCLSLPETLAKISFYRSKSKEF